MSTFQIKRKPRSVSCAPVIRLKECVQPCIVKREERKKKLEIIIDIESRTRPCPPKPKCFLVKEINSLPCCPSSVVEKIGISGKTRTPALNRRSSQPNISKINSGTNQRKISQGQSIANQARSVQQLQTSQQFQNHQAGSHKAEYLDQPASQKTATKQSNISQNISRQPSQTNSAVNKPNPSQQAQQPTASQQARLAQQQAAAIQQQMAQLTVSQHEKYVQYHSTMAQQRQPGDQLTSSQHEKWAQYHASMAQHKQQLQAQQQANASKNSTKKN